MMPDGLCDETALGADASALTDALTRLALAPGSGRAVCVLIGAAARLDAAVGRALSALFEALLVRLDGCAAMFVDGGTAYGVMRLLGQARVQTGAALPLLGVAPAGRVDPASRAPATRLVRLAGVDEPSLSLDGAPPVALDPDHSHLLLVPGADWGDESPWLSRTAELLACDCPTLTLVAGGGAITLRDVGCALAARQPLMLLAGSGGSADRLVAHLEGGASPDGLTIDSAQRSLVEVAALAAPPDALAAHIAGRLLP